MASVSSSSADATTAVVGGSAEPTDSSVDAHASVPAGTQLGRYLVLEQIGRGGMGVVLRAYDPKLQREVALKRVRTDMLDASAQARLVREARAMARLNHPNVVAVYDVEIDDGVTVVMEYVAGVTLRRWIEAEPRSQRAILDAFVGAGRGLVAAHGEGLLHRDFKLENVLIGDDTRVRVTDFGLARGIASQASEDGDAHASSSPDRSDDGISIELTSHDVVIGTPMYMAPEQLERGELDPRADQYAFCVALWRALAGSWPFAGHGRTLAAAKRQGSPKWPSEIAVPRHVLRALRRGLAPAPGDRWPTLSALLAELARDPSRRRRQLLAIGGVALAGIGAWSWQSLQRAQMHADCVSEGNRIDEVWNEPRSSAIAAAFSATGLAYAGDTWQRARERVDEFAAEWRSTRASVCAEASHERSTSTTTQASRACLDEIGDGLDALLQQLATPDATVIQKAATATATLPLVRRCVDPTFLLHRSDAPTELVADVAEVRARLAQTSAANATGRYEVALGHAEAALARAREIGWPPLVTSATLSLGITHDRLGRYPEAEAAMKEAFFSAGAAGHDELALEAAAELTVTVGYRLARYDEGMQWARVAQMLVERLHLADDFANAELLANTALVSIARAEYDEAREMLERALAISEAALGTEHSFVANVMVSLGNVQAYLGKYAEAGAMYERALAIEENTLGPEHPRLVQPLTNLGNVQYELGDPAGAMATQQRAVGIAERSLAPDHPDVAHALNNLAIAHQRNGEHAQAQALYERALSIREGALGSDHPEVGMAIANLAQIHHAQGKYAEAQALYERALPIMEKGLGPDHPEVGKALDNLGGVHALQGHFPAAQALFERSLAISERALGPDHPELARMLDDLGRVHEDQHEPARALGYYERALTIAQRHQLPPDLLAEIELAVARTSWSSGGDRTRARELATAARDAYRLLGSDGTEGLAAANAWLETHAAR